MATIPTLGLNSSVGLLDLSTGLLQKIYAYCTTHSILAIRQCQKLLYCASDSFIVWHNRHVKISNSIQLINVLRLHLTPPKYISFINSIDISFDKLKSDDIQLYTTAIEQLFTQIRNITKLSVQIKLTDTMIVYMIQNNVHHSLVELSLLQKQSISYQYLSNFTVLKALRCYDNIKSLIQYIPKSVAVLNVDVHSGDRDSYEQLTSLQHLDKLYVTIELSDRNQSVADIRALVLYMLCNTTASCIAFYNYKDAKHSVTIDNDVKFSSTIKSLILRGSSFVINPYVRLPKSMCTLNLNRVRYEATSNKGSPYISDRAQDLQQFMDINSHCDIKVFY